MKITKSKIFSLLMAASVSAMSFAPVTASADFEKGTKENPYHISTAQQLADISKDLDGYYVLDNSIDLSAFEQWKPIGNMTYSADVDMSTGDMDFTKAFSGSLDGNGYTISNLTCESDGDMLATGLFGGFMGTVTNVVIKDANVDGTSENGKGATATGGVVGYAMSGAIHDVIIKNSSVSGTNCVGGIAGGNMATVTKCLADNVNIKVIGNNDFSKTNRIIQCDVAECGGVLIGGGFTGTVNNNTVKNSAVNALGNEPVGLGGLAGCLQCMSEIKGNSVENVTVTTTKGGHAIGGLCGYAGTGDDGSGKVAEPCLISDNSVNVTINAKGATHVGGLVGTGMYYYGMEDRFTTQNNIVSGKIIAGTDNNSVYGKTIAGGVAGRATGCDVSGVDFSSLKINGENAKNAVGENKYLYESADQYDETDGAVMFNGLSGYSFTQLFEGGLFNKDYDKYWHDYCAVIVGEDNANAVVSKMKSSVNATTYGNNAVANQQSFYCGFTNGLYKISFDGTKISGTDTAGNELFSHQYKYIGFDKNTKMYEFESLDENSGEFSYFTMWSDTPSTTGHIEFRYGSNLKALTNLYAGEYGYWMGAGLSDTATEQDIENVVALFCLENMDYSGERTDENNQWKDLVGSWDYYLDGKILHDTLYFTVDKKGNGSSYYNGENSSNYKVFAYDNDKNISENSGIYVSVNNGDAKWSKYKIDKINGKTVLTLSGTEDGKAFEIQYVKEEKSDDSSSESEADSSSESKDDNSSESKSESSSEKSSSDSSDSNKSSSSFSDESNTQTHNQSKVNPVTGVIPSTLVALPLIAAVIVTIKKKK